MHSHTSNPSNDFRLYAVGAHTCIYIERLFARQNICQTMVYEIERKKVDSIEPSTIHNSRFTRETESTVAPCADVAATAAVAVAIESVSVSGTRCVRRLADPGACARANHVILLKSSNRLPEILARYSAIFFLLISFFFSNRYARLSVSTETEHYFPH